MDCDVTSTTYLNYKDARGTLRNRGPADTCGEAYGSRGSFSPVYLLFDFTVHT